MNERLTALVGAKISEFKKKMSEVRGIASEFAKDDATKDINANTRTFNQKLSEAKTKVATFASMDADKDLGLNTGGFTTSLNSARAAIATFPDGEGSLKLDTNRFTTAINRARTAIAAFPNGNSNLELNTGRFTTSLNSARAAIAIFPNGSSNLDLDTSRFFTSLNTAKARIAAFTSTDATKNIDGNTKGLAGAVARARAMLATLPNETTIRIKAGYKGFQDTQKRFRKSMDRIADAFRDFATIGGEMVQGALIASIPVLTTLTAGLGAAVATAGVQIGVMAGGLMGLLSSVSMAGAGMGLFAAAAVPTINRIKEANEAIKNGEAAMSDYSKPMQTALKGLNSLTSAYNSVNKAIEPYVLRASGEGMSILSGILTTLQPGIVNVAKAFEGLMGDLKGVMTNGEDVKKTMQWFNERAGKAVSAWGKIAGYALRGFLNLLRAFDPLAVSMEQGLLGLTKRFSEWAAGLSKSDKFKTFIEYVKTNGPKLMSSVGNIITGIVNLFAAFGPLAADMMTGFQKLTARFREWSASLGENKNFQNFVQYIRDNGPMMMSVLGNIWDIAVQLAKGLGTVGAAMLPLVDKFTSWFASLLEGSPHVRNMMGGAIALGGAIKLLAPIISGLWAVFGPVIKLMWNAFLPFKDNMIMGLKMLGPKIKGFATKVGTMATKVGGWFVKLVPKVMGFVTKVGGLFMKLGPKVMGFVKIAGSMATKVIGFLVKLGGRAVIWAARMAAQWLIAMGPVGWVIAAVAGLVIVIIKYWDEIVAFTKKAWSAVSDWVKKKWNEVWDKTKEIAQNIANWVKDKFEEAKNNVKTKLQKIKSVATTIWNAVKSFISDKVEAIRSAVSNKFQQAKQAVQDKLQSAKQTVTNIWNNIKSFISDKVEAIRSSVSDKFQAAKQAVSDKLNAAKSSATSIWNSIKSFISNKVEQIRSSISNKFQAAKQAVSDKLNAAKSSATSIFNSIKSAITNKVEAIRSSISNKFQQAKQAITDKINAAKTAAVNTVNNMKASFSNTFENIRSAVSSKISAVKEAITSGIESALDFVKGMGSEFLAAGKGLITQMASGITGAIGKVTGAVKDIAQKARNFLPFSPAKEGPLSDIDKLNFGGPIAKAISRDAPRIQRSLGAMLTMPQTGAPALAGINAPRTSPGSMDGVVRVETNQKQGGGITQNVTINSTEPLSPSEAARKQKQASRQLAIEWGM